jgi:hypothetical protein
MLDGIELVYDEVMKSFPLRMSDELHAQLQEVALKERRSMTATVNIAIEDFLAIRERVTRTDSGIPWDQFHEKYRDAIAKTALPIDEEIEVRR